MEKGFFSFFFPKNKVGLRKGERVPTLFPVRS